jgi:hypothetical protein
MRNVIVVMGLGEIHPGAHAALGLGDEQLSLSQQRIVGS